ncbi:MAG: type III pantothenate kinase [Alphaproteobacteria bacterium]|nr:type III pantothenate kinase [Alphaproteobacteria bacterium]
MLLVIDVGNTNTVIGALDGERLAHRWRISTVMRTTDEFGLLVLQLLERSGLKADDVVGASVSCVVPSLLYSIEKACRRYLDVDAMIVGRGIKTGMKVRTDNPREVGADRIVNAVAALERFSGPLVVVDFGTATTFDCVSADGAYVGGAIAPGFRISADALFERTAKLPRVEVERPARAIGTNTVHSMQSGLYWGYVGLVDELARRCKAELAATVDPGVHIPCLATGGLANLIGTACSEVEEVDGNLTLQGLRLLWERNRPRPRSGR